MRDNNESGNNELTDGNIMIPQNLIILPEDRQLSFSGKIREKSQITVDTNIMKLFEINRGDTIVMKVIGYKKNKP